MRDFFSRAFFIAAFIPALLFIFINAAILYVWNWRAHDWISANLIRSPSATQAIIFAALFFYIWINAYLVSSLTPVWTRTLEGSNWWTWLRDQGSKHHLKRFLSLEAKIEEAVGIYANIEQSRPQWRHDVESASAGAHPVAGVIPPNPSAAGRVTALQAKKSKNELISFVEIQQLVMAQIDELKINGNTVDLQMLAGKIELLIDYAINRSRSQHLRAVNERNMDFPDQADIAPTRFGNVGQTAQTYAVRAYGCNLTHFWSTLRSIIQKDESTAKSLENTKSQLDFLVAGFWLSLTIAIGWAAIFAWCGDWGGALATALLGSFICWVWWYGAAVEQYRVLQDLIISCLNTYRFQILAEFHIGAPMSLDEERDLWSEVDNAIGNGEPTVLNYQSPKATP